MAAPRSWLSHERYPRLLLALLAALSILLAIAPHDRADWALENALLVAGVGALVATHKALPLSRVSYTLIFLFCCLHAVGAHYTYSLVPYDAWFESLIGRTLSSVTGWERNHFDRLVHFLYGLLLAYPAREVFLRVADVRGFWGYYLPLDVVMATSVLYELIEWGAASAFGGDLGVAYLGTQGDPWDAQRTWRSPPWARSARCWSPPRSTGASNATSHASGRRACASSGAVRSARTRWHAGSGSRPELIGGGGVVVAGLVPAGRGEASGHKGRDYTLSPVRRNRGESDSGVSFLRRLC